MRMLAAVAVGALAGATSVAAEGRADRGFETGTPEILSMSALAFDADGVLFVGDGKAGAVVAIDLADAKAEKSTDGLSVKGVEEKIASLLGTRPDDVMIHDLAVNPVSRGIYISVSRARGKWSSFWHLPNDIGDATALLRIGPDGSFSEVSLESVRFSRVELPNPVDAAKKHPWKKGISLRADTITDLAIHDGTLYVAGLSNEEFASTMWRIPYPFQGKSATTTLEIYHGAHGEYETHAPIRAFVPYSLDDQPHLFAAYLCTPLVTFRLTDLENGAHVMGRTVGEFGSGNYPLDMLLYEKDGEDRLLIANSNLPFMIVRTKDVEAFEGEITTRPDTYLAGVEYEPRAGTGIQQMDRLNADRIVVLTRQPSGKLALAALPLRRF